MNLENYIEIQYRELADDINIEYIDLYEGIIKQKLKEISSTLHYQMIKLFKKMNERLPSNDNGSHFWAEPSRQLIKVIDITKGLQRTLKNSEYAIEIDKYYSEIIDKCETFLNQSGGSQIPPNMEKIQLYYTLPIFIPVNSIATSNVELSKTATLKLIGEGSYAQVFKYKDDFYKKHFVVKRAKKELEEKEVIRFRREFDEMKSLRSPYIAEVYCYNETAREYIMEYMDCSLYQYIEKNNGKLSWGQRKGIVNQVIKAFLYIESKGRLHRDISPKNILMKIYEDVQVIKVSDFGLVKIPESGLTTMHTEFKGYFNDISLQSEGFANYGIQHETYALTRILYYIMTGKTNMEDIKYLENKSLKVFLEKGVAIDKLQRYQSVIELAEAFREVD